LKNPVSIRIALLTPAACLLAFASQVVAQDAPQGASGSSSRYSLYDAFKGGDVSYQLGRGVTFSSANAESSMTIGGQLRAGFSGVDDDDGTGLGSGDNSNGFSVDRARLTVGGSVYNENITYFLQTDFANGGDDLVDAWVGWRMSEGINLRLGQQKMRSGLQADASLTDNVGEFVDSSIATGAFAGNRSTGVLVEGNSGNINWHFGAMNNSTSGLGIDAGGQGNADGENEVGYTGGVSIGSGAGNSESWSEGDLAQSGASSWIAGASMMMEAAGNNDAEQINAYGAWKSGAGIAVQAEVFQRDDQGDVSGVYGQGSYTLAASGGVQYGFAARFSSIEADGASDVNELAVGFNAYYHEHNLKTQLQLRQGDVDGLDGEYTTLDLMFTLMF